MWLGRKGRGKWLKEKKIYVGGVFHQIQKNSPFQIEKKKKKIKNEVEKKNTTLLLLFYFSTFDNKEIIVIYSLLFNFSIIST